MTTASLTANIAAVVVELIREQSRTPHDVALRTGVHPSTLRRRLTGRSAFPTNELEAIAAELNSSLVKVIALASARKAASPEKPAA